MVSSIRQKLTTRILLLKAAMTRTFSKSLLKHLMQAEIETLWAALYWIRDQDPQLVDQAIEKFKLEWKSK